MESKHEIPEDLKLWYSVACDGIEFKTSHSAIKILIERIASLEYALKEKDEKLQKIEDLLRDPHALHANILRGQIPVSKVTAIHIAGLPADIEFQLTEARSQIEALQKIKDYDGAKERELVLLRVVNARLEAQLAELLAQSEHKSQLLEEADSSNIQLLRIVDRMKQAAEFHDWADSPCARSVMEAYGQERP